MANNFANTKDLIAVGDIHDDAVVLKDKGLRQIVMVGGINFSLKSEDEQNILTQGYQNFLNSLTFPIQIIIHSRKINVDQYLETLEKGKALQDSALLESQISEYQEFIKGFVHENAIMAKTFFVIVPFSPIALPTKKSLASFLPFGNKKKALDSAHAEENQNMEHSLGQLRQRTAQVMQGLNVLGLEAVVLKSDALAELFYNFYNPETTEKRGISISHT